MGCGNTKKVKSIVDQQRNQEMVEQIQQLKNQRDKSKPIYLINNQELEDINQFKTDLDRRFIMIQNSIIQLKQNIGQDSFIVSQSSIRQVSKYSKANINKNTNTNTNIPIDVDDWKRMIEEENEFTIKPLANHDIQVDISSINENGPQQDLKQDQIIINSIKIDKEDEIQLNNQYINQEVENNASKEIILQPSDHIQNLKDLDNLKVINEDQQNEDQISPQQQQNQIIRANRSKRTQDEVDQSIKTVMKDQNFNQLHTHILNRMFRDTDKNKIKEQWIHSDQQSQNFHQTDQIQVSKQEIEQDEKYFEPQTEKHTKQKNLNEIKPLSTQKIERQASSSSSKQNKPTTKKKSTDPNKIQKQKNGKSK